MKKKILIFTGISFLTGLLIILGYYFVNLNNLEKYKAEDLEKANITAIFDILEINEIITDYSIKNQDVIINLNDESYVKHEVLEKNSAILYYLIDNINLVIYNQNNSSVEFDYKYIQNIFGNISELELDSIYQRYEGPGFDDELSLYLGNVSGEYDLFDESIFCSDEYEVIGCDEYYNYSVSCSQIDFLYFLDKEGTKIGFKDVIDSEVIEFSELSKTLLKVEIKEIINENSSE